MATGDLIAAVTGLYATKPLIRLTFADDENRGRHMPDVDLEQLCDSILSDLRLPKP